MTDWESFNEQIIAEFRENDGDVGGSFEGAPMLLLHHVGRKSGTERIAPLMYLPADDDAVVYLFASKGGAPGHPDWYRNLVAAGDARIERGGDGTIREYPVTVTELTGEERDRVYAEQVRRYPFFGEYEKAAAEHRTIPVLELRRT